MAKDVTINGITYRNIPKIEVPLADGSGDLTSFVDPEEIPIVSELIINIAYNSTNDTYSADKTYAEIWAAAHRGDAIWFRMGDSIQRAFYNTAAERLSAEFAGKHGRQWGFYTVYYTSSLTVRCAPVSNLTTDDR